MSKALPTKNFAHCNLPPFPLPRLTDFQLSSFNWFIKEGIKEVFEELTPIYDYTQKELKLEFLDYYLEEPKLTEKQAKEKELNYEAALRVRLRLTNIKNDTSKEQEVYFGDIPLMTPRSSFIINGVEKVVISQIIRSPGVYFDYINVRGRKLFGAKVIPQRGAWLEFETSTDGAIEVKIDRKRKVPATELLKAFGLKTNEEILKIFEEEKSFGSKHMESTLKKASSTSQEEAFIEIYKRLRPGELPTYDSARDLIHNMFFRLDRYDLAKVGRYKLNQRLNLNKPINQRILDLEDLIAIVREIIRLNNDPKAKEDDIDHLGNRRLRVVGEILQDRFRVGLMRMRRNIQDRMAQLDPTTMTPAALVNPRQMINAFKEFFNVSQLCQLLNQTNILSELEHKRRVTSMGPGGLSQERAGIEVRDIHQSHYGRVCPIQTPEGKNIGLVLTLSIYSRINEFGFIETPYYRVKKGYVTNEIVWLDAFEESKYKIAHAGVTLDEKGRIKDEWVGARVNLEPTLVKREEVDLIDVSPQQIVSSAVGLIPFLEHDESNRALMGANMQRQAVPCVIPKSSDCFNRN